VSDLIKERIAHELGPQRYKVWFKNATQFTLTEGFLKVSVPNHFIGGWIERHFSDVILRAAREVVGRDVQLTYALDPQLSGRLHKTQLNSQAAQVSRGGPPLNGRGAAQRDEQASRTLRGRLDSFVVGPTNRMAYNAALEVAERRSMAAHPLFLHGGCGLGKTHLLQGIANRLIETSGGNGHAARVAYVSGEDFTNQFLYALKGRELDGFRRRFRDADVLLVDDVHFLASKRATQDEFLHTFNAIDMVGKHVVLASDAHPRMIGQMSEALISRFVSGMVIRLDPPDYETRCDILRRRAQSIGGGPAQMIPDEVIGYIADKVRSNVRELEGALLRVVAFTSLSGKSVCLPLARRALEEHASQTEPMLTAEQIENVVATYFGLTAADLHTSRKSRTIALARSIAMYLARKHTRLSFPELGRLMGNKNHSTVLLACRRLQEMLDGGGEVSWQTAAGVRSGVLRQMLESLEQQFLEPDRAALPN